MKHLTSTLALTLISTVALFGSARAGIFDKAKNNPKDTDPGASVTVADFVEIKGKGRLATGSKVAIPNFYVQFVRDQTIERSGRVGSDSYTTQVKGIDDAALQALADALYEGFVADLQAAGIEVIPLDTLEQQPDFKDLRKVARVSPYIEEVAMGGGKRDENHQGVSILVSAHQLPINVLPTIDDYWLKPNASDGFKVSLTTAPMKLSQKLDVPLLNVRLTMAFATIKGRVFNSGGGSYSIANTTVTNGSASTFSFDADLYPRFVDGGSMVVMNTSKGATTMKLDKSVWINDLTFSLEKGKGTGSRGAGLLGFVGRAAGGQKDRDADAYIQFQSDNFSSQVKARGSEITKVFVEALKQQ